MPSRTRAFLLILLLAVCCGIGWHGGHDLDIYHAVARFAATGHVLDVYPANGKLWVFCYGPLIFAFLKPFGFLSFQLSHWIWLGLEVLAYLAFWRALGKLYPELKAKGALALWILVWIASIKPIHASFQSYNIQLFIVAALCLAELWSVQDNALAFFAGVIVALLFCVKVYPGFIAAYYWFTRNGKVRSGLVAGFLSSFAILALVFGVRTTGVLHHQFLANVGDYQDIYTLGTSTFNLSLPSLLAYWFPRIPTRLVTAVPLLSFGGLFFLYSWQHRGDSPRFSRDGWALALALMALLNPATRPDYFIFFVPAFASLSVRVKEKSLSGVSMFLGFLSFLLLAFLTEWVLRSRSLNHLLEAWRVPVMGMILLCLVLGFSLRYYNRSEAFAYTSQS